MLHARIYLKVDTLTFTKVSEMFAPPPRGPKRSRGEPRSSPGGPKSSPRLLRDTNSIYSNSRSTASRPLLVLDMYTLRGSCALRRSPDPLVVMPPWDARLQSSTNISLYIYYICIYIYIPMYTCTYIYCIYT